MQRWHPCMRSPRSFLHGSAFPSKTRDIMPALCIIIRYLICAGWRQDKGICICCAMLGNATGRSTTISLTPLAMAWRRLSRRPRRHPRKRTQRPRRKGSGRHLGWAACCCSMLTRPSMTQRRSVTSASVRLRSCRKMTCSPPEIVCAKDRTAKSSCAGGQSIVRPAGSKGTCVRSQ